MFVEGEKKFQLETERLKNYLLDLIDQKARREKENDTTPMRYLWERGESLISGKEVEREIKRLEYSLGFLPPQVAETHPPHISYILTKGWAQEIIANAEKVSDIEGNSFDATKIIYPPPLPLEIFHHHDIDPLVLDTETLDKVEKYQADLFREGGGRFDYVPRDRYALDYAMAGGLIGQLIKVGRYATDETYPDYGLLEKYCSKAKFADKDYIVPRPEIIVVESIIYGNRPRYFMVAKKILEHYHLDTALVNKILSKTKVSLE